MSNREKLNNQYGPSNPDMIDPSRPYLVPRGNGNIEVWHVEIDENGKPVVDEDNYIAVSGQHPEEVDGKIALPSKIAHSFAFSDEVQSSLANDLAMSRPTLTPDQLDLIGRESLADLRAELQESLSDLSFNDMEEKSREVFQNVRYMRQIIEDTDGLLASANYQGPEAIRATAPRLYDILQTLRTINGRIGNIAEDLVVSVRTTEQRISDTVVGLKDKAVAQDDEDMGRHLNRIEESSSELPPNVRRIVQAYEHIQSALTPHGSLESYVNEIATDTYGYETTLAQIRMVLKDIDDNGLTSAYVGSASIETAASDLGRYIRAE